MKSIILLATLIFGSFAYADTFSAPGEFEVIEGAAYCRVSNCRLDEETGKEKCRYQIRFDEQSFEYIKAIKKEKGYNKTWYAKSPAAICMAGELPTEEENSKSIKVILYKLDLSVLNDKF